jgi:hypothetical protein
MSKYPALELTAVSPSQQQPLPLLLIVGGDNRILSGRFLLPLSKLAFESLDCLVEGEKHFLLGLLESRMVYGDAIGVAYLLDTRYLGDGRSV